MLVLVTCIEIMCMSINLKQTYHLVFLQVECLFEVAREGSAHVAAQSVIYHIARHEGTVVLVATTVSERERVLSSSGWVEAQAVLCKAAGRALICASSSSLRAPHCIVP